MTQFTDHSMTQFCQRACTGLSWLFMEVIWLTCLRHEQ